MTNLIIDRENDSNYFTEVRTLLGVDTEELTDAVLKLDIILGAAERSVCKIYVPNWQDILNGNDPIEEQALRALVIIRVAMLILEQPQIQNMLIDTVRLIDIIIEAKKITLAEIKAGLEKLFSEQLSIVGVERSTAWPKKTLIGLSDSANVFDYYVDTEGELQEA